MTRRLSALTDREKYNRALDRQKGSIPDRPWLAGPPNPKRITAALDMAGLYGPEVDEACGVEEPAVDMWEAGTLIPTPEQIIRLAHLTKVGVRFFWMEDLFEMSGGILCGRDGCRPLGADLEPVEQRGLW